VGLDWKAALRGVLPHVSAFSGPIAPLAAAISSAVSHVEVGGNDSHTKKHHVVDIAKASITALGISKSEITEELTFALEDAVEADVRARELYARVLRIVELIKARRV
jgi:hypothetical protein